MSSSSSSSTSSSSLGSSSSSSCGHCDLRWILPFVEAIPVNTDQEFTIDGECCGPLEWSTEPAASPATGQGESFTTQWSLAGIGHQIAVRFGIASLVTSINVVEVGRLFYIAGGPLAQWTDVSDPLYILKGDSVIFGAEANPRTGWPEGKPVWSDGETVVPILMAGLLRYLSFRKVTFDTVGDKARRSH